jgi:cysteine-rich repeat protein
VALTLRAGQDLADPVPSCSAKLTGGSTVWYRFTPPRAGVVVANTFFSDYDTALAAYTGTCANPAVANLVEVSCSSDAGSALQSQIIFDVTAGTTYHLMITAEANAAPLPAGILRFSLQMLDDFSDCCAAHDTPGCDTAECQACVCENAGDEPACCTTVWDEACAQDATDAAPCTSSCACGFCGDGTLQLGEMCDDGNAVAADGCEPDCTPTPGATTTVTSTTLATSTTEVSVGTTTTTLALAGTALPGCSPGPCYAHPISARHLSIRPPATPSGRTALVFVSRARYELPAGARAPTEDGATLTIQDGSGQYVQFALPATSWRSLGRGGARGFVYSDKRRRHGPCTKVILKEGRTIKASCAGPDVPLTPPLTEPVDVVLQTGAASSSNSYCARFGGAITRNGGGSYVAANAPAPTGCPLAVP